MLEIFLTFEAYFIESLAWPSWALRSIAALCCLVFVLGSIQVFISVSASRKLKSDDSKPTAFRKFQIQYLLVFLTLMLADWLQGTNMYTLYMSYGMDVGKLFLTGFLTSAVFGTFLGIYVDKWGRKLGCIVFCILEVVINTLEHIPHMPTLLLGRFLGGLSTSLLFSSFESWMVSEHKQLGYKEEWLQDTFAIASWGNGLMAISAGLVAQVAADAAGDIGPFQVAIFLTILGLVLILTWRENYGHSDDSGLTSIVTSIQDSLGVIRKHPAVLCLGLSQAFFEGGVYTFVFTWVPTLLALRTDGLPTGLVFSCFMLAMTSGGIFAGLILPLLPRKFNLTLCAVVYALSALCMFVPIVKFDFWCVFVAFLSLEALLGMFNTVGATLRSVYYPDAMHASIMSVFRLPLNLLVVYGTMLTNSAKDMKGLQSVYTGIVGMNLIALALQCVMYFFPVPKYPSEKMKSQ